MSLPDSRRTELGILVDTWLAHHAVHQRMNAVEQACKYFPETAWPIILELVRQAPSDDALDQIAMTRGPLEALIAAHGSRMMNQIEAEARRDARFKQCLGRVRIASNRIPPELWTRLSEASGQSLQVRAHSEPAWLREEHPDTEFMLDWDPHPPANPPITPPADLAAGWLTYWETFWAWEGVGELVREGEEDSWFVLSELIKRSTDDDTLGAIGAGPLEDWLNDHGPRVIALIEAEAARSRNFRVAVSAVWQSRMSDDIYARVVKARGDEPARG